MVAGNVSLLKIEGKSDIYLLSNIEFEVKGDYKTNITSGGYSNVKITNGNSKYLGINLNITVSSNA